MFSFDERDIQELSNLDDLTSCATSGVSPADQSTFASPPCVAQAPLAEPERSCLFVNLTAEVRGSQVSEHGEIELLTSVNDYRTGLVEPEELYMEESPFAALRKRSWDIFE